MAKADPCDRFHRLTSRDERAGCWIWKGSFDRYGYGLFSGIGRNKVLAHRWSYRQFVAEPPAGHVVHHECENRACVNPEHLVAMTTREHAQLHASNRGVGVKVFA